MWHYEALTKRYGTAIPAHHLSRITCLIQPCLGRVTDALFISWSRLVDPLPQHPDQDTTFGIHHCDVDLIFAHWLLDDQKQKVLSRLNDLEDALWLRGIEKLRQMAGEGRERLREIESGRWTAPGVARAMAHALAGARRDLDPDTCSDQEQIFP